MIKILKLENSKEIDIRDKSIKIGIDDDLLEEIVDKHTLKTTKFIPISEIVKIIEECGYNIIKSESHKIKKFDDSGKLEMI